MPSPSVVQNASFAYSGAIYIPNFKLAWGGFGGAAPADTATLNAGASAFVGTPPSGFSAWDTSGATTFDPAHLGAGITLSNGNLTASKPGGTSAWSSVLGTTNKRHGKWYFEVTNSSLSNTFDEIVGVVNTSFSTTNYPGQANSVGFQVSNNSALGTSGSWPGTSFVQGDTWFIAVDFDAGLIWAANSANTQWNLNALANPATGAGGLDITPLSTDSEPVVEWGSTPTPGNLLIIAGCAYFTPPPAPVNGWAFFQPPSQGGGLSGFSFVIFKYAEASPLAKEQVLLNGVQIWGLSAFEIDNVSGDPWTDIISVTLSTTLGTSSPVTPTPVPVSAGTSLVLAGFSGNNSTVGLTVGWSAGWTAGNFFQSSHADIQVGYFDWSAAGSINLSSGSAAPTLTLTGGGTPFQTFAQIIQIGAGSPVGIDPLSPVTNTVGGTLGAGGSLTANLALTTFDTDEVVIIDIEVGSASSGGTPTVSITAAGLTFAQRFTSSIPGTHAFFWRFWSEAATVLDALACAVQITWPGTPGVSGVGVVSYAVGGVGTPSSPWDPDGSLPASSTAGPTISFNTTNGPDLNLNAAVNTSSATPPTFTGNTQIEGAGNASNAPSMLSSYLPTLLTPGSHSSTVGGAIATLIYADAITGPTIGPTTAVGTAAGAGAAAGVGVGLHPSVGSAAGAGAATSHATGILPAVGRAAGIADVVGIGNVLGVLEPLFDWEATVISQYQTSPTLLQLIENMETYIDPLTNLDAFYVNIWNIYSAVGYGLDVWGRIVGVTRVVRVPTPTKFLGFEQAAPSVESYDFGILFDGSQALTQNFTLSDQAFRTLILAKALANICNGSIPAMNQILINLFNGKGYGNVYVTDGENMTMTITFTNTPSAVDLAIISTSGVFPRPAGVALTVVT